MVSASVEARRKHFLGPTRKYVADKLTEALKTQHNGLPLITERQTLGSFALSWLQTVNHH